MEIVLLLMGLGISMSFLSKETMYCIGSKINARDGKLIIDLLSSKEFGKIDYCLIYIGIIGEKKETIFKKIININDYSFNASFSINVNRSCYLRGEIVNKLNKRNIFAMTNPIWLL